MSNLKPINLVSRFIKLNVGYATKWFSQDGFHGDISFGGDACLHMIVAFVYCETVLSSAGIQSPLSTCC